jgi:ElaB/YqjD/DUF883 family membrane-anchored ribosome-binding protein
MNKVLSLAVILALSSASDEFSDNNLNGLSKVREDLKKAGHFVAEHPQIITSAAKILAHDDEIADSELNAKDVFKKIGKGLLTGLKIVGKVLDDETADHELNALSKVESGVKKAAGYIAQHPEVVSTVAGMIAKKDDEITDYELNVLSKIKEDLKKAGHFVGEHPEIITTGAKIATKLIKDDEVANDDELFGKLLLHPHIDTIVRPHTVLFDDDEVADSELNAKDVFKKIGKGLLTGLKIAGKLLDDESADHELNVLHRPVTTLPIHHAQPIFVDDEIADSELNAKDVFKKIGKGLLTGLKIAGKLLDDETADHELFVDLIRPLQTVPHHTRPVVYDDEEIADSELNAKDVFKKIGKGLLTGLKIAGKLLDDETADHELNVLSKIKEEAKKAGHFVAEHPQVITTGAKITTKFMKDDELFSHDQTHHHESIKKAQRDVKNAAEILKKLHNHHERRNGTHHDSLQNLGELLHEGHQLHNQHHRNHTVSAKPFQIEQVHDNSLSIKDKLKKAADWVGDHPGVISESAKAAKILRGKK